MQTSTGEQVLIDTYAKAATTTQPDLCCSVDYRDVFSAEELEHIPEAVLEKNYGCGIPPELTTLAPGKTVLDLGPGLGRDCFIAARKVGAQGRVHGLDMNTEMLRKAQVFQTEVAAKLGYDNVQFHEGRFDVRIPLEDNSIDVIFSNCVNNLAMDKVTAYREMLRVLKPGSRLSFSDIVSCDPVPERLRQNHQAWADCVAGVLSYPELFHLLSSTGFHAISLQTDYLWKNGEEVLERYFPDAQFEPSEAEQLAGLRLYSVVIEAFKPVVDPDGECFFKGQYALYHGPGLALQLDDDPDHLFRSGQMKEVCEKTARILKSAAFSRHFTVFEPQGEVQAKLCVPGEGCC